MSYQALRLVIARPAATATEQSVLLVLAFHAGREVVGDAYEAWPSVGTIAREAGLRKRESARLALRRLERAGRLERVESAHRTNRYRIPLRPSPRNGDPAKRGGPVSTSPRTGVPPPRETGSELSVNDPRISTSDLTIRARANGAQQEGDDGMADLSESDRLRVRAALQVLAERAMANDPSIRNLLEAKAAQMVHLRDLTALAARHPQLSPEQLASWVDYAVEIGGDWDSAHDGQAHDDG